MRPSHCSHLLLLTYRFSRFLPQRILRKKCFIGRSASIRSHNEHQRECFALLSSSKSKDDELFLFIVWRCFFGFVSHMIKKMSKFPISMLSIFLFYFIMLALFRLRFPSFLYSILTLYLCILCYFLRNNICKNFEDLCDGSIIDICMWFLTSEDVILYRS